MTVSRGFWSPIVALMALALVGVSPPVSAQDADVQQALTEVHQACRKSNHVSKRGLTAVSDGLYEVLTDDPDHSSLQAEYVGTDTSKVNYQTKKSTTYRSAPPADRVVPRNYAGSFMTLPRPPTHYYSAFNSLDPLDLADARTAKQYLGKPNLRWRTVPIREHSRAVIRTALRNHHYPPDNFLFLCNAKVSPNRTLTAVTQTSTSGGTLYSFQVRTKYGFTKNNATVLITPRGVITAAQEPRWDIADSVCYACEYRQPWHYTWKYGPPKIRVPSPDTTAPDPKIDGALYMAALGRNLGWAAERTKMRVDSTGPKTIQEMRRRLFLETLDLRAVDRRPKAKNYIPPTVTNLPKGAQVIATNSYTGDTYLYKVRLENNNVVITDLSHPG